MSVFICGVQGGGSESIYSGLEYCSYGSVVSSATTNSQTKTITGYTLPANLDVDDLILVPIPMGTTITNLTSSLGAVTNRGSNIYTIPYAGQTSGSVTVTASNSFNYGVTYGFAIYGLRDANLSSINVIKANGSIISKPEGVYTILLDANPVSFSGGLYGETDLDATVTGGDEFRSAIVTSSDSRDFTSNFWFSNYIAEIQRN